MKKTVAGQDWSSNVLEIRSFLEETYKTKLPGKTTRTNGPLQISWARIGHGKFCDRIIPVLMNSGEYTRDVLPAINTAVRDCVAFGNSTIILNSDGSVRVSTPETSKATKDVFGQIIFEEKFEDGTEVFGVDGSMVMRVDKESPWEVLPASFYSIFYGHSATAKNGSSRITPAIRNAIRAATRNKMRIEEGSDTSVHPMRIINGFWDDISPKDNDAVKALVTGQDKITGLPLGPKGEKLTIDEFAAASIDPFLKANETLAREVAAAFNIDPSEMGLTTPVPSSAEALYMSKEDLVLEVTAFEQSITRPLQNLVTDAAIIFNESAAKLTWAEPATPSKASMADSFIKISAAIPQLKYSKAGLLSSGLSAELVEELLGDTSIEQNAQTAALLKQLENDKPTEEV